MNRAQRINIAIENIISEGKAENRKEIAAACGVTNPSSFSQTVKRGSAKLCRKLGEIYGADTQWLLNGTDNATTIDMLAQVLNELKEIRRLLEQKKSGDM